MARDPYKDAIRKRNVRKKKKKKILKEGKVTEIKGSEMQSCLDGMKPMQRRFVVELIADKNFSPTAAAKKAGYASPANAGKRLMANERVKRYLELAIAHREERTTKTADDIIEFLHKALYLNPLEFLAPSDDGDGFVIKDFEDIPKEFGKFIKSIEQKQEETRDGRTITRYKVKLMDKDSLLNLAMKHHGLLQHNVNVKGEVHHINWNDLLKPPEKLAEQPDPIEQKLKEVGNKTIIHVEEDDEPEQLK